MSCTIPCTTDDVVAGLAQLAELLHGLAAFAMIATAIALFELTLLVAIAFVNGRT